MKSGSWTHGTAVEGLAELDNWSKTDKWCKCHCYRRGKNSICVNVQFGQDSVVMEPLNTYLYALGGIQSQIRKTYTIWLQGLKETIHYASESLSSWELKQMHPNRGVSLTFPFFLRMNSHRLPNVTAPVTRGERVNGGALIRPASPASSLRLRWMWIMKNLRRMWLMNWCTIDRMIWWRPNIVVHCFFCFLHQLPVSSSGSCRSPFNVQPCAAEHASFSGSEHAQ